MNKISHSQAQQYIQDAADQLLGESQARDLSAHLAGCPACRQYRLEMDHVQDDIRRTLQARASGHPHSAPAYPPIRPPDRLYQRIRRNMRMRKIQKVSYAVLGLLVLLILVLGGIYLVPRLFPPPIPAVATPSPTPTLPQPTPRVLPTQAVAPGAAVTITFAAEPAVKSVYQPLMEAFHQAHPNITVQFVEIDATASIDLATRASLADTSLLSSNSMASAGAGYFRDLTPLMEVDPAFQPEDFWPNALTACQDGEGRSYGVPLSLYFMGILYDPQALDAAGLAHPQPGWTWDDFRQLVNAIPAGATPSRQYPFVDLAIYRGDQSLALANLLAPALGNQLAQGNGSFDAASLAQSLRWYLDLVREKRIFPVTEVGKSAAYDNLFKDGYPVLWIGATNSWGENGSALNQYDMAPFPVDSSAPDGPSNPFTANCGVVSAGSNHPQEAWAWLDYISKQWLHGDQRLVYVNDAIPARPSVANGNPFWESVPANAQAAIRFGLEHGWYGSPYADELWAVSQALVESTNNGTDLAAALGQAKTDLANLPVPEPLQTPIVVATPRAPDGETITLRFYTYEVFEKGEKYKKLVEEFTRLHPDIQVELSSPQNPTDFPSNTDDLFAFPAENYDCFSHDLPDLANRDLSLLYDVNTWLEQDPTLPSDFYPGQLAAYSVDGKTYGLPASMQPNLMFYNKTLLDRLGIEAPQSDWTFDDFIRLATAASTTLDGQKVYGFAPYASRDVGLLLAGQGIDWLDLGGAFPAAHLNEAVTVDAYRWMAGLAQSGVLLPTTSQDGGNMIQEAIYGGRLAFWTAESGAWGGWYVNRPDQPVDFEIGAVVLPLTPALNAANNPGMTGLFISRKSQNPQACWTWLQYLSEQPDVFPGVPARRSVTASPAWETSVGPQKAAIYRAALEQSQDAIQPASWENHVLNSMFYYSSAALADTLHGVDPGVALSTAQRKTESLDQCLESSNVANLPAKDREAVILSCLEQVNTGR